MVSNAQWQIIDQNIGNGVTARTDIEIAPDGTIYLAYLLYSGGAYNGYVKKYTGSNWEMIGAESIFSLSSFYRFELEIASDGTLYIAYNDETTGDRKMSVSKFNGSNWELVGTQGFSDGEIQFPQMAFDSNDVPYVVYRDFANGHDATVQKFNGTDWEPVGEVGFTEAGAWCTSIILDHDDVPYVSYMDWANGQKISVDRFVEGAWEAVGNPGFSIGEAWTTNMGVDANNVPHVIYDDQGDSDNSYLKRWNGSSWETLGGGSISGNGGLSPDFVFDQSNNIYTVYQDYDISQAPASVKKLIGNNWEYIGEAGFAGTNCQFTSIAIDNDGAIFVSYVEMYNGQALTVAKYPQEIVFPPTQQASNIVFDDISGNSIDIIWTNGNGNKRLVFIKEGFEGGVEPVENNTYAANSIFGSGDEINGWYCVYNGEDNAISVLGLTVDTDYRLMVCEYNGQEGEEKYLTVTETGNPANVVTLVSSINESVEPNIRLYPNPTNGIVNLTIPQVPDKNLCKLEISDITGKTIYSRRQFPVNGPLQFDISNLRKGLCVVKITLGDHVYTQKLNIQ